MRIGQVIGRILTYLPKCGLSLLRKEGTSGITGNIEHNINHALTPYEVSLRLISAHAANSPIPRMLDCSLQFVAARAVCMLPD